MTSPWINEKIKEGDINSFEYNEFINAEKVGEGGFAIVHSAYWKSIGIKVALKCFNNPLIYEDNMSKFLKELKNLRQVNFHPNVNRIFGITKEPLSNDYIMVLEYANQGNLREYLKSNFDSLKWKDKIQMAIDIACGLKCLHARNIIHRDLHAKNILAHNNKLMIADLGLSKQLTVDVTSNSKIYGMVAYIEPQCYKDHNYIRNKKSDIYSLGVLLWEITSGRPPFPDIPIQTLSYKIATGHREQPIINTPSDYVNLYRKCWDDEPNSRPNIDDVLDTLEINTPKTTENLNKLDVNNETNFNLNSNSTRINSSQSQLSKSTNNDNISDLSLSQFEISTPLSSVSSNIIEIERESSNRDRSKIKKYEEAFQKEKNRSSNLLSGLRKNEQNPQKPVTLENQLKDKESGLQQKNERQICELKRRLEEIELRVLTKNIIMEYELGKKEKNLLKDLLEEQRKVILNNGSPTPKKLEEIKRHLSEGLSKEVIQNLLNRQIRATQLEMQLKYLQNQEQQYETQPSQVKFEVLKDKVNNRSYQQSERQICELKKQLEEIELKELKNNIIMEYELGKPGKHLLEELLEGQRNIILNNDSSPKKLEEIKRKLGENHELTKEEIQNLLNKKAEITQLEMQLRCFEQQYTPKQSYYFEK